MNYTYRTFRTEEKVVEVEVVDEYKLSPDSHRFGVVELYEFGTPSLIASFSVEADARGFLAYIDQSSQAGHTQHEIIIMEEGL